MALKIGISLYVVRIRNKRAREFLPLDAFDGRTDFFQFFLSLVRDMQNQYVDVGDERRKSQINGDFEVQGRAVDGTIDVGEYGLSTILKDEHGADSFERLPIHAEMIPMYYRGWFPTRQDFGAFALQNYGNYGCKTAIQQLISGEFREVFPDYIIEMREAVSRDMIQHYINNGVAKEFTFLQHGVPRDWADGYGGTPLQENEAELEIRIKARKGGSLQLPERFVRFLTGDTTVTTARLFELSNFECETFKVKMDINGQPRTLSHSEFINMTSRMDVTADVSRSASGHPEKTSIHPIAIGLLENLVNDLTVRT